MHMTACRQSSPLLVRYVADDLGEGWFGWRREAVKLVQRKAATLPLKLLFLDVCIGKEEAASDAADAKQSEQATEEDGVDDLSEEEC